MFDETGRICRITFATGIMYGRPCKLLTFADGAVVVADDEHRWFASLDEAPCRLFLTSEIDRLVEAGRSIRIPAVRLDSDDGGVNRDLASRCRRLLARLTARFGSGNDDGGSVSGDPRLLARVRRLCAMAGVVPRLDGMKLIWSLVENGYWHVVARVQPVPSRPVRCLTVDSPSSLFLCTDSLIPTHNTFLMAEELRRAARLAVRNGIGIENEIWYGAPTFLQAKRVMWSRLKRAIPRQWISGKPNETACFIRLVSGHTIRLVGLDSCDNLRGSGLWFFGGDEWADCRPSAWLEVVRPMLSTTRGHALFIGTPKGFDHFRDAYLLGQPGGEPGYRSFLFTTEDGGNVPAEELEAARRELDERTFRQEYCSSFETYAGRVVYAFSRRDHVAPVAYDALMPIHIGMDFNINPMSATVWQERGETSSQIDEIILPTSNTDEMADEICRRYGRAGFEPGRAEVGHITVYPDPAGAQRRSSAGGRTDIGILQERGFKVCALRSHPAVRDRMNTVNRQFKTADGQVFTYVDPRCVRSIEAYERLVFRDGTNEPDKTQGFDHLVDATGYYLCGRRLVRGGSVASSIMER